MENKMETAKVYWGYVGNNGNELETAIVYWGYVEKNGKENGNSYSILGLYGEYWKIKWKQL